MTQQDQYPIPDDAIYDDAKTVETYTRMGRTAIYAAIRDLEFPEPYQVGKRIVRFRRSEVLAWLESRQRGTRLTAADRKRAQKVA